MKEKEEKLDRHTMYACMTTVLVMGLIIGFTMGLAFALIGVDILDIVIEKR